MRDNDEMQLRGGRLIHMLTVSDPCGVYYAQCNQHKDYFKQIVTNFEAISVPNLVNMLAEEAQHFIDSCPLCKPPFDPAKSRFLEGAEL